ncbi:hypothetical protein [Kitasatospora sp. NPDC087314]|uniref:hypothetical protein n=1 Tax=Kitasatospora sp. NPDC087314 TaxID=3364068 RepID=UPI00381CBC9A
MSNEDMVGAGYEGGVGVEGGAGYEGGVEAAAARGLGELAGSVEGGAIPYDRLVAGGRRRLRRRRLLTSGAVAVLVAAVVGGGTALGGLERGLGRGAGAVEVAAASSVTAAAPASAPVAAAPTVAVRDPFTPIRTMVGHGTAAGRQWQAWTALWPATATKEDAFRQAQLIWEDRHTAIPQLPKTTQTDIDRGWHPDLDLVNLYLTVDGKRQVDDTVHDTPAPGTPGADSTTGSISPSGSMLGFKGGEMGTAPVVIAAARPDVAKIVVTWDNGGSTEAVPVTVGDSPTRWYAIAKKPGAQADTYTYYGADGAVLSSEVSWFRSS